MNSSTNELIIFSNHEVIFFNEKNKTSDAKKVNFEIKGIEFFKDQLFIASSNEIFIFNGKNIIKLPLESDNMDEEEIQTFRFSEVSVYRNPNRENPYLHQFNPLNGQTPLPFLGRLELHRSGITKLYF